MLRTHHVIASGDGRDIPNPAHEPSEGFVSNRSATPRDPLEDGPTSLELTDPDLARCRQSIARLARRVGLDVTATEDLLLCVNEVATNAILHGRAPVVVRAWGKPSRVVVAVSDTGWGPEDPFAGLHMANPASSEGGRGLWLTHQFCPETALTVDASGFTVRLAAGDLEP